jgi:hypothetical protein
MVLAAASLLVGPLRGETCALANEKAAGKPADYWKRKTAMAIGKPELADASDDDLEKAHDAHMAAMSMANDEEDATTTPAPALANERRAQQKDETGQEPLRLANEKIAAAQKKSADLLIANAMTEGRILAATKADWEGRFANDFEEAEEALKGEKKKLNTSARSVGLANDNSGAHVTETERRGKVQSLVNEEMTKNGGDYDLAFTTVQRLHKSLFEPKPAAKK